MQVSNNYKILESGTDEQFLAFIQYVRPHHFEKYEFKLCTDKIVQRCDKLNLTFEFGCCGSNIIRRKK